MSVNVSFRFEKFGDWHLNDQKFGYTESFMF